MLLVRAKDRNEFRIASSIYDATRKRLEGISSALWSKEQTSPEHLAQEYSIDQLYFLEKRGKRVGAVFLMEYDPAPWPEIPKGESLFFHKLSIHPSFSGRGYGMEALRCIVKHAEEHGFEWLRLDCDDREALHRLYQGFGFSPVDVRQIGGYTVCRYKLSIIRPTTRSSQSYHAINRGE